MLSTFARPINAAQHHNGAKIPPGRRHYHNLLVVSKKTNCKDKWDGKQAASLPFKTTLPMNFRCSIMGGENPYRTSRSQTGLRFLAVQALAPCTAVSSDAWACNSIDSSRNYVRLPTRKAHRRPSSLQGAFDRA